jgi:hypothetical protein
VSKETSKWLNTNVLIGVTEKRGHAWHYRAEDQGTEPNHYPGPIPITEVKRRLFAWTAQPARVFVEDRFGLRPATAHLGVTASDNGDLLAIHTDEYEIHQYSTWLLDNVDALLDDGLTIGSAGLLRERKQAWVSVEVPGHITTPEGVEFRPNLLACSSHDASLKTRYKPAGTTTASPTASRPSSRSPHRSTSPRPSTSWPTRQSRGGCRSPSTEKPSPPDSVASPAPCCP